MHLKTQMNTGKRTANTHKHTQQKHAWKHINVCKCNLLNNMEINEKIMAKNAPQMHWKSTANACNSTANALKTDRTAHAEKLSLLIEGIPLLTSVTVGNPVLNLGLVYKRVWWCWALKVELYKGVHTTKLNKGACNTVPVISFKGTRVILQSLKKNGTMQRT